MNKKGNKKDRFFLIHSVTEKSKTGLKNTFRNLFTSVENAFNFLNRTEKRNYYELDGDEDIEVLEVDFNRAEVPHEEIAEQQEMKIAQKDVKNDLLIESIITLTNNVKTVNTRLNELETLIEYTKDTRVILLTLKEEIIHLKEYYNEKIVENQDDLNSLNNIIEIDMYNLRNTPKEINRLLHRCNLLLSKIKKINKNSNDPFHELKLIVEENLKSQDTEIEKLKKSFKQAQINKKRSVLVHEIHDFLAKTITIGLNLSPVAVYKNNIDGMLISLIVINNRIRNIREIIRKENKDITYNNFDNISKDLNDEKSCIEKTKEILDDTFYQLENLKQEFIMEFYYDMERYPESDDIMTEFSSIEYQITSKQAEFDNIVKNSTEDISIDDLEKMKL